VGIAVEPSIKCNDFCTAADHDAWLDNLAADLTRDIYPLLLERAPKDSWIHVELGLWRALAVTLEKWAAERPAPSSSPEAFAAWREGLFVDLTKSALLIALQCGVRDSLFDLERALYGTFRSPAPASPPRTSRYL
jgi:hypothetical protein